MSKYISTGGRRNVPNGPTSATCGGLVFWFFALALACVAAAAPQDESPDAGPDSADKPAEFDPSSTPPVTVDGSWALLKPHGSGFQTSIPGPARHVPKTLNPLPDMEVKVDMYLVHTNGGEVAFVVGWHDVQEMPESGEKRKEILDGGVKGAMLNVLGKMTSHEHIDIAGNPGRDFSYTGNRNGRDIAGRSHLVLVGRRVFQLSIIRVATVAVDEAVAEKFFSSFELTGDQE